MQAPNVEYMVLPEVGNTWSFPAGIGISVDSENVEAAWEFIKWYVGDQDNMTDIYNAFGLYPSRISISSALNEAGEIEGYDVIVEQSMHTNELPRFDALVGSLVGFRQRGHIKRRRGHRHVVGRHHRRPWPRNGTSSRRNTSRRGPHTDSLPQNGGGNSLFAPRGGDRVIPLT